jgi:chromosomal replication initiator protein
MVQSVSEIASLWNRILARIKEKINDSLVFDTFFNSTYINSITNDTMVVVANSGLSAKILSTKYQGLVNEAVREVTETNYVIKFIDPTQIKKAVEPTAAKSKFFADSRLNPDYTFKNFVVGPSNREAYQAAVMVANTPGRLYNPLFIFSNSGLGKTHLLHAIGNAIKEKTPSMKVLYVTTNEFFDEFVHYVQGQEKGEDLHDFFKNDVDVLLIDDIQFLVGRKGTEEMFFTVFQTLTQAGKQIVITSDKHPDQLEGLAERLKTRFKDGLPLSIKQPEPETCVAILKLWITNNGLDVADFDEDALQYFASKFGSNARDLHGAFLKLLFYKTNIHPSKHVDLNLAMDSVASLTDVQDDKTKLSIDKIINTVADYYNLAPYQLTGKIRTSQIAMARHISMYLCRSLLDAPFAKIGEGFGGKDHATVMNGVSKVENGLKTDKNLQKAISDLESRLKS